MDTFVTAMVAPVRAVVLAGGWVGVILVAVGIVAAACVVTVGWGVFRGEKLAGLYPKELLEVVGPTGAPMLFIVMVATYATAIGLLGTVFGLQQLFGALGSSDPLAMAGGISKALTCTGAGVGLSIGCGIALLILRGMNRPVVAACQVALEAGRRPLTPVVAVPVRGAGGEGRPAVRDERRESARGGEQGTRGPMDTASAVRAVQVRARGFTLMAIRDRKGKVRYVLRDVDGSEEPLTEDMAESALSLMVSEARIEDLWAGKEWVEPVPDAGKQGTVVGVPGGDRDGRGGDGR